MVACHSVLVGLDLIRLIERYSGASVIDVRRLVDLPDAREWKARVRKGPT